MNPKTPIQTTNGNGVLIIVAHPDDEVLGCGGTVARHVSAGDRVMTVILTEGVTSRYEGSGSESAAPEIKEREAAACAAASKLGTEKPIFLRGPNLRLRDYSVLDLVKQIEAVIADFIPSTIYTHHGGDLNSDHRVCHEAVMTACRPFGEKIVSSIYGFEIPSSTEWSTNSIGLPFMPTRFVDISKLEEKKFDALKCYEYEMREFPHPRSREAITASHRRYGSFVGLLAAEAFVVFREIVS